MKSRKILNDLMNHSKEKEITLLIGARQTGKTTLLKQVQDQLTKQDETIIFFNLEDELFLNPINEHPKNIFQFIKLPEANEKAVIIIDEIQYLKNPSNFLKLLYDEYAPQIKLIVSGSSSFYIDKKFTDSLAGRKKIFELPTMGFKEYLYFRGYEKFADDLHLEYLQNLHEKELASLLSEYLTFGGYPQVVIEPSVVRKIDLLQELASSYIKKDIEDANLRHPEIYFNILKIIAGQTGGLLNLNSICKALKIEHTTIEHYLYVMRKSFHIALVSPFYKSVVTEIRKMKKVYFQDLGLRNFFAGNFEPVILREDRGELFENYVFRLFNDVYDLDWDIKYWRTQKKQEVDFIIKDKQAYEVKFSEDLYKPYKYKFFQDKYPNIPLHLLTYNNIFEFNPEA